MNLHNLINKLRRTTNSSYFIPEIDGLRFYAIITVVIFHLNTAFAKHLGLSDLGLSLLGGKNNLGSAAWWLVRLDLGVKVFFAISGMVLALPFLRHYLLNGPKVALGDYFYRRLTRLEPPFVISLLVFLGVHVAVLGENFSDMLPHFWAGLLYAHVLVFGTPNPINPVTWSLETEAQFYLLVPLFFALLFVFRNLSWSVAIMLLSLFVSIWLRGYFTNNSINQLSSSIFAYLSNFLVGIVIAWAYLKRPKFFEQRHILWDIIGLLAIFSQFYFYKPQHHYLNNVLFNTSVLLMMISVFKGIGMNWFFTRPLVYIIGGMCYSIYLLHYAFFHLLVKYTSVIQIGVGYGTDLAFQLIICIPLVLLVSSIFFLLIEKPCMNKNWPSQFSSWVRSVLIRA